MPNIRSGLRFDLHATDVAIVEAYSESVHPPSVVLRVLRSTYPYNERGEPMKWPTDAKDDANSQLIEQLVRDRVDLYEATIRWKMNEEILRENT